MSGLGADEGAASGAWKIEPGVGVDRDGVDQLAAVLYKGDVVTYAKRDDLPDLLGALMLYLDVKKIEAV